MADRITQLKALLDLDPDDAECLYSLAFEYGKVGDVRHALEYFDRTVEVDPDYCYAYYHKARVQSEAGDTAGAMSTLRRGLERARRCGDEQATSEIGALLDGLS